MKIHIVGAEVEVESGRQTDMTKPIGTFCDHAKYT
jgi:hypothetical protein